MTPPLVSVLMTSYNREKYIAQAIESVLQSSFENFELLVVDDGSTDATVEIARSYAASDARAKVHCNPENLGDYFNRNRAAELAQGQFLKYLDSDDTFYPHGLEVMVRSMEQFPDAALGMPRPQVPDGPFPLQVSPIEAYRGQFLGKGLLDCGPSGTIMRADAFRAAGGFSGRRYVGDTEMWFKLAAVRPVVQLVQGLTWWRIHEQQEFALGHASFNYAKWSYIIALEALTSPLCPLPPDERTEAVLRLKHRQVRHMLGLMVRRRKPRSGWKVLQEVGLGWREVLCHLPPTPVRKA